MTMILAAIAVPINTVFGVCAALSIARNEFPGKVSDTEASAHFEVAPPLIGLQAILPHSDRLVDRAGLPPQCP